MAAAHSLMQCKAASTPLPYIDTGAEAHENDTATQQDITINNAVAVQLCNTSSMSADAALSASSKTSTTTSRQLHSHGLSAANRAFAAVAEQQDFSHSNSSRLQTFLQLSMPWWQHVLVSCLSMAVMATYMSWEADWCCQEAAHVG